MPSKKHSLTVDTPPGRWLLRRAKEFKGGYPVVGVTPDDLLRAGIERVPRVTGVGRGRPVLEDGRVCDVATVIWATGFVRDYRWIKLPVFDRNGDPIHHRGVALGEPGLYFVRLPFQTSLLSGLVAGAGDDAKYVVEHIARRARSADHGPQRKQSAEASAGLPRMMEELALGTAPCADNRGNEHFTETCKTGTMVDVAG